jgi:AsmA protein
MRTAKILGYFVGGVIAVIALGLLSVWLLVNPNQFKPQIAAAVKEATGRDLQLQGDIKLSLLPWIALQLGPATLSNPSGFGAEPFVAFQHAAVRVRFWPLLHERLAINHLQVEGLDVTLQRNAQGQGNWQGLESTDERTPALTQAHRSALPIATLAGIEITHARLRYQNFTVDNLNLETSPLVDGVVPVSIHFDVNRGVPTEHASVEVKVAFSNPAPQRYRLAAVTVVGQASLMGNNRPVRWNFATPNLDLDLAAQTLAAPMVTASVAGAQLSGSLQGTQVSDDLHLAGSVILAPLVLREFIPRWGLTSPHTRDPRGFSQFAGSAVFVYGGHALRFDHVEIALDDTHVRGSAAIEDLTTRALSFALAADSIDVDRYLAPVGQPPDPTTETTTASEPATASAPAPPLIASGTFTIGALHVSRLDLTDVHVTLASKDGVTHVFPLVGVVDGGRYSGDITLDRRGSVPTLSVDEHLSGVDMARLLAGNSKNVRLSGKGSFSIKATGHGASVDAITKTLNGRADAYIADGAVEGVDLGYELSRAEAIFERDSAVLENTHRTRFDAFKTSAEINSGIAQTTDLMISSPVLKVTGQGAANLVTKTLDFHLLADTLKSLRGVPVQIPLNVTGSFSDPTVKPDIDALAKGQLKQKLEDVLRNKLHNLFGKP